MSVIYRADCVLPMDDSEPVSPGEIWVGNGRIRDIGQSVSKRHPQIPIHDLGCAAVLPGFVNAHSHIEYTLSRNRHDALNLWQWLGAIGFKGQKQPNADLIAASARLGAAECAYSGITCMADSSFSGIAACALDEIGLRGIVYKELFGQSMGADYRRLFSNVIEDVRRLRSETSDRIDIGISPHSVYTSNIEVLKLCAETDMPVAIHLAETRAEEFYTLNGAGPLSDWRKSLGYDAPGFDVTPTQILNEAGLLRDGVILAHGVHLRKNEIAQIAASGAGVAHCPRSNAYLGAGIFPLRDFQSENAKIGLGTDSSASCLRMDFFEEMRFALAIHRARMQDAGTITAKDILGLATHGGAVALGLDEEIGRLKVGMRADMIAVGLGKSLPDEDIYLNVISKSPDDVILRLVDGVPLNPDVDARAGELKSLMEQNRIA